MGVLTWCLYFAAATLDRGGQSGIVHSLHAVRRGRIVPVYLVWLLLAMALAAIGGPGGLPAPFGVIVSSMALAAGLLPYAFPDYLLSRLGAAGDRN